MTHHSYHHILQLPAIIKTIECNCGYVLVFTLPMCDRQTVISNKVHTDYMLAEATMRNTSTDPIDLYKSTSLMLRFTYAN